MPKGIYDHTGLKHNKQFKKGTAPWNKGLKTGLAPKSAFKKGAAPWNKDKHPDYMQGENHPMFGKHHSEETKGKISASRKGIPGWGKGLKRGPNPKHTAWLKGRTLSDETKLKMSNSHKGEKSSAWKGGITTESRLQRVKFKRIMQKQIFERDNYTCQMCKQAGGKLQVDHIQSWAEYVELRFSIDNCRTLCMDCHYFITFGKSMPKNVKTWGHNLKERMVV